METIFNDNTIQIIKEAVSSNRGDVYLFRSRVRGKPRDNSDLDIAILAPSIEEYYVIKDKLVQSDCVYLMDFINLSTITNQSLKRKVLKDGYKI